MDFVKLRRAFIWVPAAAAFALCWAGVIAAFGPIGLYLGWIPALILAPVAALAVSSLWSVIALTTLLGWHVHASERGGAFGARASA